MKCRLIVAPIPAIIYVASALVGVSAAVSLAGQTTTSSRPPAETRMADPANTFSGTFSAVAADLAQTYDKSTVLWLGEEFEGLRLDRGKVVPYDLPADVPAPNGRSMEVLSLIYGDCEPRPTTSGSPSCVPPLQIQIRTPGAYPSPARMQADAKTAPPYSLRGAVAVDNGTSTVIWLENGVTVTVHSNQDIRRAVLDALTSANAETLKVSRVGPGEDLRSFGSTPLPNHP